MTKYVCDICYVYEYDPAHGDPGTSVPPGTEPGDFPDGWECPFCGSDPSHLVREEEEQMVKEEDLPHFAEYLARWARQRDDLESHMERVHYMAVHAESVISSMRTRIPSPSWDSLLLLGAQLATLPLNADEEVSLRTVIGPRAKRPLRIEMPVLVTHMSFGSLSKEAKVALARGSAMAGTAIGSGEGGILEEELEAAGGYIYEHVPNRYSYSESNLGRVDAIELKIGQSSKPGMGGHLPAEKVTAEIAAVRGKPAGQEVVSPARFPGITGREGFGELVDTLREAGKGIPVGMKIAAGRIEDDIDVAVGAGADFITVDGRPGGTASTLAYVKDSTSVPTLYALERARTHLDRIGAGDVTLIITGGLRSSADTAKALALGADAVAMGTACMMAIGCQQYRVCATGKCPTGVTTHDPELRKRLVVDYSSKRLANFLGVMASELAHFARLTGNSDVHGLDVDDLVTSDLQIAKSTRVRYIDGRRWGRGPQGD